MYILAADYKNFGNSWRRKECCCSNTPPPLNETPILMYQMNVLFCSLKNICNALIWSTKLFSCSLTSDVSCLMLVHTHVPHEHFYWYMRIEKFNITSVLPRLFWPSAPLCVIPTRARLWAPKRTCGNFLRVRMRVHNPLPHPFLHVVSEKDRQYGEAVFKWLYLWELRV